MCDFKQIKLIGKVSDRDAVNFVVDIANMVFDQKWSVDPEWEEDSGYESCASSEDGYISVDDRTEDSDNESEQPTQPPDRDYENEEEH